MNSKVKSITAFAIVLAAVFMFGSSSGFELAVSAALTDNGLGLSFFAFDNFGI